uniref:consortin isoform X2 n=1 Tax=Gasterosteus aculeatus aculeatus TaxID=481459 RepID=UPI001A989529|nr:consortin isoform X2 [Gasterosteus aculeatus aculeatus]
MSRVQVGGADLCDNLPSPDALTAQTRNFNETNALASLSPSQKEEGGGLIQRTSVNNNGKEEEQQGKEGYTTRGREEEDEEEDIDEWMKGVEEDEESEGSSGLIRCQSPETPMTDSSYSETGSLLETPYPFSPGTSPEPASPLIPAGCPETAEISQIDVKVDPHNADLVATTLIATSDTNPPGPTCITDKVSANTDVTAGRLASSTESVFSSGPTCVRGFPSTAETFTVPACTAMLNPAIASTPMSATAKPLTLTAWPATPGTDSTATTGAMTSNCDRITSTPVPTGVATCATGPPPRPALLESLEELAQRGDDTHLPLYLHQIAEAFVLHKDYQRALWCIQLERLYHQRVLDNLNALQQQWGSQCSSSFFDPATQHLDTLKNLCRTHRRPGPRDAVCAFLDLLRPTFEEGSALSLFTSVHRVDEGMEQKAPNPSHYQSSHVPSFNLTGGLHSPEISEKARSDPGKEVEGGVCFHGDQVTDKHSGQRAGGEEGGGVEYATSVRGNGLHPSTAGIIDQSKPAEPQGGDLGPTRGKEAKREVKEAAEALEMEDEEGEDEQEKSVCQKALPVDTLASGADVELHHEAPAEEKLHEESPKTCLHQETRLPQEAHTNQHEQDEEVKEGDDEDDEEEEEEYNEVEQVDVIKEASSLDDMAKLITVEEVSPASGLVSILKKRRVCVDTISMSTSTETQPDKIPAKRRVRFKAPDDGYDQDVGGGDSCLLLFLLCLVTVVISVGGTALYCALGDTHSSVCQDFSRNADFYIGQLQSGIAQLRLWFAPGS